MADLPLIQLVHQFPVQREEDSEQVYEEVLPYTELKFVHEVWNEHVVYIEPILGKANREGTLEHNDEEAHCCVADNVHTWIGLRDLLNSNSLMRLPAGENPL